MRYNFFRNLYEDLSRAKELRGYSRLNNNWFIFWIGIFSPRFLPVLLYRLAYFFYRFKLSPVAKIFSLINLCVFGLEVGIRCEIGGGLFFPHTSGIVIGAVSIGKNATIYQGVTIGARELDFSYLTTSRPVIGDDVVIAAGAIILGAINIGNRSRIGANSVVLISIPDDVLAVGVPARVVKSLN